MTEDWKKVEQLHAWVRQVFSLGGMWPMDRTFVKFYIGAAYFTLHMVLALSDLVNVFGDLSLTIANLIESTVQIMVTVKMMIFRHSSAFERIVQHVQSGSDPARYKDQEEKNLYLSYITTGRMFFVGGHYLAVSTCLCSYFKTFDDIPKAVFHNETIPFILPYRIRLFFNIEDTRTYIIVYLSQAPMMYYYYVHAISVFFLCTLIVHVAGDLSILAHRIRRINWPGTIDDPINLDIAFRDIVIEHKKIIVLATMIDDIYNMMLLEELGISTVLLALTSYNTLKKSLMASLIEVVYVTIYCLILILMIFVYCIAGDYLLSESVNVHDAYYQCNWYSMPSKYHKDLIICMCRARRPLQLTAGRFYILSLPRFSEILKTALAYISMLRTVG